MPYWSEMEEDQRRRVKREIMRRRGLLRAAAAKLRERLLVPGIRRSEELLIELELVRLRFRGRALRTMLEDFENDEKTLTPPSTMRIEAMAERVSEIKELNVANRRAKTIIRLATELAGKLDRVSLTDNA